MVDTAILAAPLSAPGTAVTSARRDFFFPLLKMWMNWFRGGVVARGRMGGCFMS